MKSVPCAVCGGPVMVSTSNPGMMTGAPDFDTRPGEPVRSTLSEWVAQCPGCGYCSSDPTHIHEGGPEVVRSDSYQSVLHDASLPPQARAFWCYSVILEHARQWADAGWSALHAAWASDDAGDEAAAVRCRRRVIDLWKQGKQAGQNFGDDLLSEFALVADVYRRAGQFEQAVIACSEALDQEDLPPELALLLRKQKSFVEKKDMSRHCLSEVTVT